MKCLRGVIGLTCILYVLLKLVSLSSEGQPVIGTYPSVGMASWYSPRRTASGEGMDKDRQTCAMRKKGYGSSYEVCNVNNGRCIVVRHNDFGPSKRHFREGRIIDLSLEAFAKIADQKEGLIKVTIQPKDSPQ